jgi:CBS domain-containing protein
MTGILDARPKVGYFYSGVSSLNLAGNSINNKIAKDIMSNPLTVKQDISIYDVIINMFLSDVGSIFIIDNDDNLCGVVSRKDLLKATIGGSDINKIPIGMIMTRTPNVITVNSDENIVSIVKKIIEHQVDSLPVVETNEEENKVKVVGRISKTNITKLFLEMLEN